MQVQLTVKNVKVHGMETYQAVVTRGNEVLFSTKMMSKVGALLAVQYFIARNK